MYYVALIANENHSAGDGTILRQAAFNTLREANTLKDEWEAMLIAEERENGCYVQVQDFPFDNFIDGA